MQSSVISSKLSVLSFKSGKDWFGERFRRTRCVFKPTYLNLRNQPCQHQLDFVNSPLNDLMLFRYKESEILSKKAKIIELTGRTECHVQELPEFRVAGSATTFCYIRRNRERRSPHLTSQSKSFIGGKWRCRPVNAERQRMALAPDIQFSKILHRDGLPPEGSVPRRVPPPLAFVFTHNLALITYNSG